MIKLISISCFLAFCATLTHADVGGAVAGGVSACGALKKDISKFKLIIYLKIDYTSLHFILLVNLTLILILFPVNKMQDAKPNGEQAICAGKCLIDQMNEMHLDRD